MKKQIILWISLCFSASCFSQYYFKDIVSNQQARLLWKTLVNTKINTIILQSYEADGQASENFFCEQQIDYSKSQLITLTRTLTSDNAIFISTFNAAGQLIETLDSMSTSIIHQYFTYNEQDQLVELKSVSYEADGTNPTEELHKWFYTAGGRIEKMEKIKSNKKVGEIIFTTDEKNNVTEETIKLSYTTGEKIYYYYDSLNRLTDIVRYNTRAKRLLPENTFTYDAQNRLYEMATVQIQRGRSGYQIWRYFYNENGLKQRELLYNQQKQLVGRIEYTYK